MIGQTVSHYTVLEKLGEGGMGVVYRAHDTRLGREVALKFLPPSLISSPEEIARFEQEAKTISVLNHPNIATLHDVDEAGGRKFLVLEYIPGGTLKGRLTRLHAEGRELGVSELLDYGIQMADGLAHAHRHQVIHRDIKCANLMLTGEGKLKITDFGLSKLRGTPQLTRTGSTLGTLAYMAPEQLRGEELDHRADIFSFGVVLYELATSRLPFRGEHEAAISYAIAHEEPAPVRSLRPGAPEGLERIISRCLSKDPNLRYQGADAIAEDLRALQQSGGRVAAGAGRRQMKRVWQIASAVIAGGAIVLYFYLLGPESARANGKTIAVLPFANLTGQKEDEYFSDGMTDDILTQLAKVTDLKVISRTTMMQYKGTTKSVKEIGRDLNAGIVLEGSVRRAGDSIRIVAQLINANTDEHLWADTYDKEYREVFAVQSDVAKRIAASLKAEVSRDETKRLEQKTTEDPVAYDLYLKGRYAWNKRLPSDLRNGIRYFEEALRRDPGFAKAYAGLADSYVILGDFNILPPKGTYGLAKEAAEKALAIDGELAEAHTSLAYALMRYNRDWPGAEKEFRRALSLAPNSSQAHSWYGLYLSVMGRFDEAAAETQRARTLDPFSAVILTDAGLASYFARRYDEAISLLREALRIDPSFVVANIPLGGAFMQQRMDSAAIAAFQQVTMASAVVLSTSNPVPIAALACVYGLDHRKEDALMHIELLEEKAKTEYVSPYWMAVAHSGLGDVDEELRWLERAYAENDGSLSFVNVEPIFESLHADPRYRRLLKQMGLEK